MARADVSRQAVRWFLDDIGYAVDEYWKKGACNKDSKKVRKEFLEMVKYRCCYCGCRLNEDQPWHLDHIVPANKIHCGITARGNLIPACVTCNHDKQDLTVKDFLIKKKKWLPGTRKHDEVLKRVQAMRDKYGYKPANIKRAIKGRAEQIYRMVGECTTQEVVEGVAWASALIEKGFRRS